MELIFVRHGQGDHTESMPDSLQKTNPSLTREGIKQVEQLRSKLPLTSEDVLIVSPTLRTLQTAWIWSEKACCQKFAHPLVGPRIFPVRPAAKTLPCDELMDTDKLKEDFPTFEMAENLSSVLWSEGINVLPETEYRKLTKEFIAYCKSFKREKIYIVSHDGTITSYRQTILEEPLTREDFLGEAHWSRVKF